MKERYTEFQNLYLAQNCKGKTIKELTDEFNAHFGTNKSNYTIRIKLRNSGLYKFIALQGRYSDEQLTFIYINRWENLQELTAKFNQRFNTSKFPENIKDVLRSRGWTKGTTNHIYQDRRIKIGKKYIRLDFYVWECVNGSVPAGYTVIHPDNDITNNQISNLRLAPDSVKRAFAASGFSKMPKVLAPVLYAQLLLKDAITQRLAR
ncbi:HNH endonuclease [Salmonella enterica subsp. houtenae]|nr:HNH endonuclease [Salmonella enterica subsp. houtenae]